MSSVLIAIHNTSESQAIIATLETYHHTAQLITEMDNLMDYVETVDALILDTDFSGMQGVDILMKVVSHRHIPVLMITPSNDSVCAIEALRCGAAGYLVKTDTYVNLVPMALQEIIDRYASINDLKYELVELRKRIGELEEQLSIHSAGKPIDKTAAKNGKSPPEKHNLIEIIARKISSGELALPSYPAVLLKLKDILRTDAGLTEVAHILSQDAAISAKLMKLANSAQYANTRKVTLIEDAVNRLGLTVSCNIAEMVANQSLYAVKNNAYHKFFHELWMHSIACAHACMCLEYHISKTATPKLFSLGLLHDVGKLTLLHAIATMDPEGVRIHNHENISALYDFLEAQHARFGVYIMKRWGFDEEFCEVAHYHGDLKSTKQFSHSLLVVHLANLLARSLGYGHPLETMEELEQAPSKSFFSLKNDDLDMIGIEIKDAIKKVQEDLAVT